jgi:hypothetical protein
MYVHIHMYVYVRTYTAHPTVNTSNIQRNDADEPLTHLIPIRNRIQTLQNESYFIIEGKIFLVYYFNCFSYSNSIIRFN